MMQSNASYKAIFYEGYMRTTITISDALLKELFQYTHTQKTTEAINIAISEWLKFKKINQIKKLQGKLAITDNIRELRKLEIKKLEKFDEQ